MKNQPNKIYLNVGDFAEEDDSFEDLFQVTWCTDKIFEDDLEYIREPKWLQNLDWNELQDQKLTLLELTNSLKGTQHSDLLELVDLIDNIQGYIEHGFEETPENKNS